MPPAVVENRLAAARLTDRVRQRVDVVHHLLVTGVRWILRFVDEFQTHNGRIVLVGQARVGIHMIDELLQVRGLRLRAAGSVVIWCMVQRVENPGLSPGTAHHAIGVSTV